MSDTGRVAIVTGAAGGIGRAMVRGLLGAGLRVAAVDMTKDGLATLAGEHGGEALLTIEADLSGDAAAGEIVGQARARFGKIDILVNNAGVGQATLRPDGWRNPIRFWEVKPDDWRRFVAVHTTAPLLLAQAVIDDMKAAKWGRIVNVTTSLGTMIRSGSPTYGPSKAALEALSAIMAKDLEGSGITVNVLVPGGVTNTGMVRNSGFDPQDMIQPGVMAPPAPMAVVGGGWRGDRAALPGGALGCGIAAGPGGGGGRRTGRLDQHRDDADRAAAPRLTGAPAAARRNDRGRDRVDCVSLPALRAGPELMEISK